MKKIVLLLMITLISIVKVSAQTTTSPNQSGSATVPYLKKYKMVIQLTNGDTAVHRATVKQMFNALTAAPNTKIEIVCHNNGITFLQSAKTIFGDKIKELQAKGVIFAACENTLRERKIDKTEIVSDAIFVPAGIMEVVDKQSKKWAYIKAGF
jgi:uncharacterized protein